MSALLGRKALRGIPPLIAGLPQMGKPEAQWTSTVHTGVSLQVSSRRMPACPTILGTHRLQIRNRCDQDRVIRGFGLSLGPTPVCQARFEYGRSPQVQAEHPND